MRHHLAMQVIVEARYKKPIDYATDVETFGFTMFASLVLLSMTHFADDTVQIVGAACVVLPTSARLLLIWAGVRSQLRPSDSVLGSRPECQEEYDLRQQLRRDLTWKISRAELALVVLGVESSLPSTTGAVWCLAVAAGVYAVVGSRVDAATSTSFSTREVGLN